MSGGTVNNIRGQHYNCNVADHTGVATSLTDVSRLKIVAMPIKDFQEVRRGEVESRILIRGTHSYVRKKASCGMHISVLCHECIHIHIY